MFDKKLYMETFAQVRASEKMLSEVLNMTKQNKQNGPARVTRLLLIAAVLSAMLATTAFAYVGFTRYENPMEMLAAFFGDTSKKNLEGGIVEATYYDYTYTYVQPTIEQVPLDEAVAAEDVAPYVSDVGQAITYGDYTLTVEAHLYDSTTGCGVIYYTLDNPNGVSGYELQYNGEICWPNGEKVKITNCRGKNYIIDAETTDTHLSVGHYYCDADEEKGYIKVSFSLWLAYQQGEVTQEQAEEFSAQNGTLHLPLGDSGVPCVMLDDYEIAVSPLSISFRIADMDFLRRYYADGTEYSYFDGCTIEYMSIRFQDGSEYVLWDDERKIKNTTYESGDYTYLYCTFNRLIDVDRVAAVIINEMEFTAQE